MTNDTTNAQRPSPLRRGVFAAGLVAGGIVLGAGTVAVAHGDMAWRGGWRGGWHHGPRIGMIQHIVRGALDNVGATTAQEDKIHDIIATTYTDLDQNRTDRGAMRKQLFDLLKAPKIDPAAVEKLRAEKMGDMDAKSKKVTSALLDAMGQLTPDQRTKLIEHVEARMGEHGWGGWRHGDGMDGHDGGSHDGGSHDGAGHDGAGHDGGPDAPDHD